MKFKKRYLFLLFLLTVIMLFFTVNINEVGLKGLSFFKKLSQNEVAVSSMKSSKTAIVHDRWDKILKQYVSPSGQVNYKGILENRDTLKQYLDLLSEFPPDAQTWTEEEQLTYWINAYNAFTVELILRYYPIKSIKEIGGSLPMINSAWDIKFFKIGGVDFDLNTIEHEILRKEFDEPRIHFAINCASVSCPILLNEAYTASKLEDQLQRQAIHFVNNPKKNQINNDKANLSKIFNWFENDFTRNGTLIDFVNQYSQTTISSNAKTAFMDYDWNLNE